jgi:AraC-like DNA-binding protein
MLSLPDPNDAPTSMQAFVGGLHTHAARIRHSGRQHGIAVELTPLGARAVLGMPASELTSRVVDLTDVLGVRGRQLTERLGNELDWRSRFAALDTALSRRLREKATPGPEVRRAWEWILERHGTEPEVDRLAKHVGWSRRHLTARFRREVGLPPRQLSRVLRFERSCEFLRRKAAGTYADLAVRAGYFDQAHMTHEWQRLAGCTPSEWAREELPSVQDSLDAEGGY